jgi:hypothetical protein
MWQDDLRAVSWYQCVKKPKKKVRLFENRVLKKIFGPKEDETTATLRRNVRLRHIRTKKLTPLSRALLGKPKFIQLLLDFPRFINVFTRAESDEPSPYHPILFL